MKKPEDALFWEFIDNLSPFKNKYFYPVAFFIFILIAITFPPDNYDGFLLVSSSSKVQNSHRVLFDATFLSCITSLIFLTVKYAYIGFDPKYQERLRVYSLDSYRYVKSLKPEYTPKKTFIKMFLVFGFLIFLPFLIPVVDNLKHNWMYRGNVYISFIGMYFLFLGALSGTLMSIFQIEVYRNVRRK